MNIYSATAEPFSEESDRIARTVATCVGMVLANVDRGTARPQPSPPSSRSPWAPALATTRPAKGIVTVRHGCSSDEAFKILIRRSQEQNVKLRLLASDLVEEATQASPPRRSA